MVSPFSKGKRAGEPNGRGRHGGTGVGEDHLIRESTITGGGGGGSGVVRGLWACPALPPIVSERAVDARLAPHET